MNYKILQGDNRTTLKTLPSNSIDAIVTDPPYGIDFLGKSWDATTGALETYQECLRVLKPGGHILAFSAARTYHHLAITLEKAGFEIRDQIMWIYSSGFPKSQNVGKMIDSDLLTGKAHTSSQRKMVQGKDYTPAGHYTVFAADKESELARQSQETKTPAVWTPKTELAKQYKGYGTALKPAHEPICMARKPLKQSIAKNCQEWGTGALNIDAARVPYEDQQDIETYLNNKRGPMERSTAVNGQGIGMFGGEVGYKTIKREVTAEQDLPELGRFPSNVLGEIPAYQKYFYCPKISRGERHIGFDCDVTEASMLDDMGGYYIDNQGNKTDITSKNIWLPHTGHIYIFALKEEYRKWCEAKGLKPDVGNNHPTVKPVELMKYLIRLITPPGGTVLDPFNGSGSTGMAAVELGYTYIGCELDSRYVEISQRRIEAWHKQTHTNTFSELFELC